MMMANDIRPEASRERLLDVKGLTIEIETRRGPATIVDGIDLHVDKGETLGIVGESGCGKSLTMLSLMRLLPNKIRVTQGEANFAGRDLQKMSNSDLRKVRGGEVGFIFQDPMTSLNPVMRIGQQLAEPLIYHRGMSKAEARNRAGELLKLVGIPGAVERLDAYPHELSGGMRQRVMIAIGACLQPATADRRRADHRTRRNDPGADRRSGEGAARQTRHVRRLDHP